MKNKTVLYVSVGVLLFVVVGGVLVVKIFNKPVSPPPQAEEEVVNLPPVDSSVVVDLKPKADSKSVVLSVSKIPAGTDSLEYELSYLTGAGLPKGALGKITLGDKTEVTRDILLGTCSTGGKCTYDTGVTSVKLVLKFNSASGSTQFSKEYPL